MKKEIKGNGLWESGSVLGRGATYNPTIIRLIEGPLLWGLLWFCCCNWLALTSGFLQNYYSYSVSLSAFIIDTKEKIKTTKALPWMQTAWSDELVSRYSKTVESFFNMFSHLKHERLKRIDSTHRFYSRGVRVFIFALGNPHFNVEFVNQKSTSRFLTPDVNSIAGMWTLGCKISKER